MSAQSAKNSRKSVSLPPGMWQAIGDFRFDRRLNTESEALRCLIEAGLNALADHCERCPITPGPITIAAMNEAEEGKLEKFDSIRDLMAALHAED